MNSIRFLAGFVVLAFATGQVQAMSLVTKDNAKLAAVGVGALGLLASQSKLRKIEMLKDWVSPIQKTDTSTTIAVAGLLYVGSKTLAPAVCREKASQAAIRLPVAAALGTVINKKVVAPLLHGYESFFEEVKTPTTDDPNAPKKTDDILDRYPMVSGTVYCLSYPVACGLVGLLNTKLGTSI